MSFVIVVFQFDAVSHRTVSGFEQLIYRGVGDIVGRDPFQFFGAQMIQLALGGRKALDMIATREPFDAILCDLMMPGMSGIELFHTLRAQSTGIERRIVFMTGGAFTPEAEAFLDDISNGRVEKPFDFANVDRLLRQVLDNGRR